MAETLGVIGNISLDISRYPNGQNYELLGGAALYVARAASEAGLAASPIAVVGEDLAHLRSDPGVEVDLAHVLTVPGRSCRFDLACDGEGQITAVHSDYGIAGLLTGHAIEMVDGREFDQWHVACRRPLDVAAMLGSLTAAELAFSVDFHLASATEETAAARDALPYASVVFVNAAEHKALVRHVDADVLSAVVVSDGPREATVWRHGKSVASALPPAITVREVTGAGDTLAGTFLALTTQGASDQDALTGAVAAASRHIASPGHRHPLRE